MAQAPAPDDDDEVDYRPLYVRLKPEQHDRLKKRAVEEDRSMAATVRIALDRYLDDTDTGAH